MIKLTKQLIFKNKIMPVINKLKHYPTNTNARIALATINHYMGKRAISIENSLNIYNRDYFVLALTQCLNRNPSPKLKLIYVSDLHKINSDGISEYFLLGKDKRIYIINASDVMNVITTLLNK